MLNIIKQRCGIAQGITVYDEDIQMYIKDCEQDMIASGVPESLIKKKTHEGVTTAVTFYVKAFLGNDRTDTDKYMELYRKKVFRLSLEEEDVEP